MLRFLLIIIGSLCASLSFAAAEIKGTADEVKMLLVPAEHTVMLKGQAEEKAYADRAIVNLIISTTESQLAKSLDKNASVRAAVTTALKAAGVADADINTAKFATSPQFGWFGKSPDSYEVVNRIAVTVTSESQLRAIGVLVDQNKELELAGTAYEHSQKAPFEEQVKKKALENVLKQRAMYEEMLGVKLVPIGIREADIWSTGTDGASDMNQRIEVTGSRVKRGAKLDEYTPPPSAPRTFDEIKYGAKMSIEYRVQAASTK